MSYQKLLANSQSLADLLDENMPDLPQDKRTPEEHGPRLDIFRPAVLFKDNEKNQNKDANKDDSKEAKEPKDKKEASSPDDLELELENLEINDDTLELEGGDEARDLTKKLEQEQEDEEASSGSRLKLTVDTFLQQLPVSTKI
ncbi:Regulator of nonsense transcripts 2 [Lemmus lemmus]